MLLQECKSCETFGNASHSIYIVSCDLDGAWPFGVFLLGGVVILP
jgi:hypothetical protein